jgi:hypothetical protein
MIPPLDWRKAGRRLGGRGMGISEERFNVNFGTAGWAKATRAKAVEA